MPYSHKRAKKIAKRVKQVGEYETALEFGITEESVRRACRIVNETAQQVTQQVNEQVNEQKCERELPKVLVFDVETSPILARVWYIWQQNVGLNQIKNDWFILSYSAKWLGSDEIFYQDLRGVIDDGTDAPILGGIWKLLDEADIVITQNGKKFDCKKLNARFIMNGYQPPSGYKHIDTLVIAKRIFGFTSNKLEYMSDKLCKKYKKQVNREFAGFDLWKGCLADNIDAWNCMEKYNKYDVLSLEELYTILAAWDDRHPNFNLYTSNDKHVCRCGSTEFISKGYAYTQVSKFKRWRCKKCGAETRGRVNLLEKEERAELHVNIYN